MSQAVELFSRIASTLRLRGNHLRARISGLKNKRGPLKKLEALFAETREGKENLEKASKDLESQFLNASAEFEKLTGFTSQFVKTVETLVCLATGKAGDNILFPTAVQMIEHATQFLVSCQAQTAQALGNLRNFNEQIEHLLRMEAELQRTIAPLKFVQTLFKSECAPLGPKVQQMFDALTQEMEKVHGRVRDIFGTKFKQLEGTHKTISLVVKKLENQSSLLSQITSTQKTQIEASLENMRKETTANQERDVRLSRLSKEIAREVEQVVMGLQFQDIISQKLQHVMAELSPMEAKFDLISSSPQAVNKGEHLHFIHQSSSLLAKQLEVAGKDLATAEEGIQSAIHRVLTHLTEMDSHSLSLDEFKLLTTSFDGIVQVLLETISEVRKFVGATAESATDTYQLLQPLGGMASGLTEVVRGLSSHIHLIGLNAQVQAAQAAQDHRGLGLEVLSARTSEISVETDLISEKAAEKLDEMVAGLAMSVKSFEQLRAGCLEVQQLLNEQGRSEEQQLHAFRDSALNILQAIGTSFGDIRTQATTALEQVSFQNFREVFLPSLQSPLQRIAESAQDWIKAEKWAPAEASLIASFKNNYTMHSERQIFDEMTSASALASVAVLNPKTAAPIAEVLLAAPKLPSSESSVAASKQTQEPSMAPSAPGSGSGDLGENVELF